MGQEKNKPSRGGVRGGGGKACSASSLPELRPVPRANFLFTFFLLFIFTKRGKASVVRVRRVRPAGERLSLPFYAHVFHMCLNRHSQLLCELPRGAWWQAYTHTHTHLRCRDQVKRAVALHSLLLLKKKKEAVELHSLI